jgi:DNA replication and repair protein RecF
LAPWTDALVRYGAPVMHDRADFVRELAPHAARLHGLLAGEKERLEVKYHCSVPPEALGDVDSVAATLRQRYEATVAQDGAHRTTHVGPHRDELRLHINGRLARQFASQGQQRTAALALRLAEIPLATRRVGEPPVLLLDDVMSELDPHRAEQVLGLVTEVEQILLTGTHLPVVAGWPAEEVCAFEVRDGAVAPLDLGRNAAQERDACDASA